MKSLLYFSAKVGIEDAFKRKIQEDSLHVSVMKGNFGIIFGKRNVTQEPGRLISFLLLP